MYTKQLEASDGSQRQLTREEKSIVHILKRYMKSLGSLRLAFDAREDLWAYLLGQFTQEITVAL